jgi:5-methylcytosine-specific restriction endonuclease McrA
MFKRKPIDLKTREGRNKFYQTTEWRLLRRIKLTHNPYCEECLKSGVNELATEVHHNVDIAQDSTKCLSYDNLTSLCKSCHSLITSGEHNKPRDVEVVNKKWKF